MVALRVLHVIATGERRGAELAAYDLVRALNEEGVRQRVAVLRGRVPLALAFDAPTVVLPRNGRMVPGLRLDGRSLRALHRIVGAERPTLIHAHGGEPMKYSVLAANRRAPVVYRRIGESPESIHRGIRRVVHGRLMRRPARVVAVADAVRRETIDTFGVPPDRVLTIPRGVDAARMTPTRGRAETRRSLGIDPGAAVILSLGALTWEKDPLAHLEVANRVLRVLPETVHVMAGEGPLRHRVEEAAGRLGIADRVRILGSRTDVGDLLAASDVMLLASRMEGMPGCLIEAGMAGLPVAAYAVAGVPEVVLDGTTGRLVAPGDLDALTEAVLGLLRDETARATLGAAARDRCRAVFDIRAVAARYLDLYREVAR